VVASYSWLAFPVFLVVSFVLILLTILFGVFAFKHPERIPELATEVVEGIQTVIIWGCLLVLGFFLLKLGKELASMLKELAHVVQAWIHALGERKRNEIYAMNATHIAWNGNANIRVSSLVHETRHIQQGYDKDEAEEEVEEGEAVDVAPAPLTSFLPLVAQLAAENTGLHVRDKKWLLGTIHGEPKVGKLYDFRGLALCGAQGQGKTSDMVFQAFQGAANGFDLLVIDPHLFNEEGLVPRLKPVRHTFVKVPPHPDDEAEIMERFEWLEAELRARNTEHGMRGKQVLFVFIDEYNDLLRHLSKANRKRVMDIVLSLAGGGRKYGIFLFISGQIWTAKAIGTADVRYSFPSRKSFSTEWGMMQTLLNCSEEQLKKLIQPPFAAPLRPLQAVFASANGELYRLDTPFPSAEDGNALMHIRNQVSASRNFGKGKPATTSAATLAFPTTTQEPLPLFGTPLPQGNRKNHATIRFQQPVEPLVAAPQDGEIPEAIQDTSQHSHPFQQQQYTNISQPHPVQQTQQNTQSSQQRHALHPTQHLQPQQPETDIPEEHIQAVMALMKENTPNSKIIKSLWPTTPSGGHEFRQASNRLSAIQSVIVQRYLFLMQASSYAVPFPAQTGGRLEKEEEYA
jgi:hypothetical protein